MSSTKTTTETNTPITTMYQGFFSPTDESIPYRLVGSYEYTKALEAFTSLLESSTSEEIAIYDKVLNERREFSFFNGVSLAFERQPNLLDANQDERVLFEKQFKKRGLAWMMALARIELAATSSLYGNVKRPFEALIQGEFDLDAYVRILHDDVVAHMRSLSQEPGFKEVLRNSRHPDTWTLAYLRRLKLIRDMLQTLGNIGDPALNDELEPYAYELKKYEGKLITQVARATAPIITESADYEKKTTTLVRDKTVLGKCSQFVNDNFGATTGASPTTPSSSPTTSGGNRIAGSE